MSKAALAAAIAVAAGTVLAAVPAGIAQAAAVNPAPAVVPSLQQWTGGTGTFRLTARSQIVVDARQWRSLASDARTFAADTAAITGRRLPVAAGSSARAGDVFVSAGATGLQAQGYTLDIGASVQVTGADVTGVFYGEQTIEQILKLDPHHVSLPHGSAQDWPDYSYRGVMLDMGRHYYAPAYVEQEIREAAWHKLDTVHLHLTEYNAFRLQSTTYPGLAAAQSYSHADLAAFSAEARRYHVTLLPEIDVPAHSTAIYTYDPQLQFGCPELADSQTLDVTKPQTLQFVENLLKEFVPLFPGAPVFHTGGDEYPSLADQESCPELVSYAQANGFASTEDVFVNFQNQLDAYLATLGKRMEIWNWWDVAGGATIAPNPDIVIDAWTGTADSYLSAGYDTVASPDNILYVTPEAPPGGSLQPDDQFVYQSWAPQTDPHLQGYELSRWSDNAFDQPDSYFSWFASAPEEVLAARLWGGPRAASVFTFEDQAAAVGSAPGVPESVPPDAVPLSGTPYGTSPAFGDADNTFDKAFDGDPSTFFDYSQADGGYTGIDLGAGNAAPVTAVRFIPRSGQAGRMTGGVFQGCADGPDSGCTTLATVPWNPPGTDWSQIPVYSSAAYRWLRYVGPDGGYSNVAEIQFLTSPAAAATVSVSAPAALHALGTNTVAVTVTNTTSAPLAGVTARLSAASEADDGILNAPAAPGAVIAELAPHTSATLRLHLAVPLGTPAGAYALTATVTWRAGRTVSAGIAQAQAFAQATLPAPVTAGLTPAAVQPSPGSPAQASLQITSTAGGPVRAAWQAAAPAGSGVSISPAAGTVTVPAGGQATVHVAVTAGSVPGTTSVPVTITATGGGATITAAAPALQVSVPYPDLAAAFNNTGMTEDSDVSPPALAGGLDGDGSSLSQQELASIGITPGGALTAGGQTFTWPAPAAAEPDNVLADGQVITVSGSGDTLGLLSTGTYFPPSATLTVTYTDGTTSTAAIADTDWQAAPPAGSDVAVTTTYHNLAGTGQVTRDAYIYLHQVPLDPGKTVASVTLPDVGSQAAGATPALHIFAITIS